MVAPYAPQQGDIVLLDFSPQSGHEQKGRRPALVASNNTFHQLTNLAIVCPITTTDRGFPLHVPLDKATKTRGVIMCEQAKSLDLSARQATFVESCPQHITNEVVDILIGSVELLRP
ncbi:MAG: type II toxin-antitoxin system PemK/MazF family toxin [Bacillota bacterium]|nr:type II toxin-antitoxin system PemK/MazF family toxin [Bacillota bacterium]